MLCVQHHNWSTTSGQALFEALLEHQQGRSVRYQFLCLPVVQTDLVLVGRFLKMAVEKNITRVVLGSHGRVGTITAVWDDLFGGCDGPASVAIDKRVSYRFIHSEPAMSLHQWCPGTGPAPRTLSVNLESTLELRQLFLWLTGAPHSPTAFLEKLTLHLDGPILTTDICFPTLWNAVHLRKLKLVYNEYNMFGRVLFPMRHVIKGAAAAPRLEPTAVFMQEDTTVYATLVLDVPFQEDETFRDGQLRHLQSFRTKYPWLLPKWTAMCISTDALKELIVVSRDAPPTPAVAFDVLQLLPDLAAKVCAGGDLRINLCLVRQEDQMVLKPMPAELLLKFVRSFAMQIDRSHRRAESFAVVAGVGYTDPRAFSVRWLFSLLSCKSWSLPPK
jgi:hypothetical protein